MNCCGSAARFGPTLKITAVIPTYNEAENLPRLAEALFALPLPDFNILFVDDNSPDGTGQLAEKLSPQYGGRISVLHRPAKMGLGSAYIEGYRRALLEGAEAILQMDADFSHPIERIPLMVETLARCDYVIGSRYVAGGSLDEQWPRWRKALSAFGNFYARTILGMRVRDCTGGFKLWRSATLRGMPYESIRSNGYVSQVEMNYVATRLGFKAIEIPIYFADRRWGKSKMNFRIQIEAALRTWALLGVYKNLHK
jgi:dolichol-phosphate mannosyltransferase